MHHPVCSLINPVVGAVTSSGSEMETTTCQGEGGNRRRVT